MNKLQELAEFMDDQLEQISSISRATEIESTLYSAGIKPPVSPIEIALNLICDSIEKEKKDERTSN